MGALIGAFVLMIVLFAVYPAIMSAVWVIKRLCGDTVRYVDFMDDL